MIGRLEELFEPAYVVTTYAGKPDAVKAFVGAICT